jgi:hypothetical protein
MKEDQKQTKNTHYNAQELKEYLSDEARRPLLNWAAIETAASLSKYRIKNLCLGRGKALTEEEVARLNKVIRTVRDM